MWAGLVNYRLCDREYQCAGCPTEEMFRPSRREAARNEQVRGSVDQPAEAGLSVAPDRFHDPQHLWLRVLPHGRVQVGLDPMAALLLRPSTALDLPRPGTRIRKGDVVVTAKLKGGEIQFASPIAGDVLRVHPVPTGRLRSMLKHPYSRAWLWVSSVPRLEVQLGRLLFGRGARLRVAREWNRFRDDCLEIAATAPGGVPVLPDGGILEVNHLEGWAGPEYARLVRRWIGVEQIRPRKPHSGASAQAANKPGGSFPPPAGR
jgi:glycine cleavage system H lipoate-binding protein